jgi:hypothetical protein
MGEEMKAGCARPTGGPDPAGGPQCHGIIPPGSGIPARP